MLKITRVGEVTRFEMARTVGGRGRYWTAAYLVDGLLVDTGCALTGLELVEALSERAIMGVVNTHSHEDHIGGNGPIARAYKGLDIRAHPLALPVLAAPRTLQPLQAYRRLMWGWPEPSQGRPISDGDVVETESYRFQVVHTPGHGVDHICLWEPDQGWLLSGDLFVGGQDRALRADFDIWGIIASLKRIATLPATLLLPGSARVRENPGEALASKIAHLEAQGERVLELHRQGQSPARIARILFGGPMFFEAFTLGHYSRKNLVLSYLRGKCERKE